MTLTIYLIGVCDAIRFLSGLGLLISTMGVIIFFAFYIIDEDEDMIPYIKKSAIALVIFALLILIIPSSKTLTAMYVIPPLVNSEVTQQLPDLAKELIKYLEK